jgi:predicted nucleic acid-binding Zn finger protein
MAGPYIQQWEELGTPSKKTGKTPKYIVSLKEDGTWECGCPNWCTTVVRGNRENCKHISRRIATLMMEASPYCKYLRVDGKKVEAVVTKTVTKVNTVHTEETHRTILFGDV